MNKYIYLDNSPAGRLQAFRLLSCGYFVVYEDSTEILLKKREQ